MKLEVGKFYKTRDGRKVGPMVATGHVDVNMAFNCVNGCGWTLQGTEYNYAESENDLIAEWQDEPLKTQEHNTLDILKEALSYRDKPLPRDATFMCPEHGEQRAMMKWGGGWECSNCADESMKAGINIEPSVWVMSDAPQSNTRAQILDTAKQYVTKDRQATHGKPEDTFGLIAELWGAYLGRAISPVEVCAMMALLKIARSADNPTNADNWIDLAGYAACAGELAG